jgi:hypothetical protein
MAKITFKKKKEANPSPLAKWNVSKLSRLLGKL